METKMYMENIPKVQINRLIRISEIEKELIEVCEKLANVEEDINFELTDKYISLKKQMDILTDNYLSYNLL
jgi:hypothetical protein